ncbi:MAG: DUF6429 family protein [Lyngbya sp.]|nr:DUF6429 family protein [Lyngbya sp.]
MQAKLSDIKRDFEAATNRKATRENAIQECGFKFIHKLNCYGISVNYQEFWQAVNKQLNIPDGLYLKKKEDYRIQLLTNAKVVSTQKKNQWEITVFELQTPDEYGNKFVAECTKDSETRELTAVSKTKSAAHSRGYNLVYELEKREKHLKRCKILQSVYLIFLYLSSSDEYFDDCEDINDIEKLWRITSWINLDFEILDQLENEELLTKPQQGKKKITYISLTPEGVQKSIELLKQINLEGLQELLEEQKHHTKWVDQSLNEKAKKKMLWETEGFYEEW